MDLDQYMIEDLHEVEVNSQRFGRLTLSMKALELGGPKFTRGLTLSKESWPKITGTTKLAERDG